MADGQRRTFSGREGIKEGGEGEGQDVARAGHRNRRRRNLYATDPSYAERIRRASLDTYRKEHPLPVSKLSRGLLARGTQKEVYVGDDLTRVPVVVEAFTVPEAATALGRSELCIKRWIADGLIPPPILRDTTRGYRHYSAGELSTIAAELKKHEADFAYLTATHTVTINAIWQMIQGYRATRI